MPLNCLDLAGDRLRVVHRGRDQLVEIDVLDVEGLAHVGAAVAQELHHLVLVPDRIELGLDRVRAGRDLAECQRGGEDLDEEGFIGGATYRRLRLNLRH